MGAAASATKVLERPLAGRHIAVTRPRHQARHLQDLIAEAGGETVLFPLLTISDVEDPAPLRALAPQLDEYDLAVFVSPNAVERALEPLLALRAWPAHVAVATVGKGSERALARFGLTRVIAPVQRFDSEALLELPELQQMAGKRVLIFRGDGGRELLGQTLAARGARVDYLSCYRRGKPAGDAAALLVLQARGQLDALTVTSSEGLRNLVDMAGEGGRAALATVPLFVPHSRIAAEAAKLGLSQVIVTPPGDEGLLAGLSDYFSAAAHGR